MNTLKDEGDFAEKPFSLSFGWLLRSGSVECKLDVVTALKRNMSLRY